MKKLAMIMMVGAFLVAAGAQAATVTLYTNEADWLAAVSCVETLAMNASDLAKAEEVSVPPGPHTDLGSILTFNKANTGLTWSFELTTLQSGAGFIFSDHLQNPSFTDKLSVGNVDTHEDDDWKMQITDGPSLYACAFVVGENDSSSDVNEVIQILGEDGTMLEEFPVTAVPGFTVFGVVSDTPIGWIEFHEHASGDDIWITDFRFAVHETSCWQEQAKLLALDAAAGDWFGCSVDISDNITLIGVPYHDGCASDSGAVYLFDVSTGAQLAKLTPSPSDCAPYDQFGNSVAISGNTAVIGAWGKDSATGAVYLFDVTDPNNPIQTRKLTADDAVPDAYFGWSVAFEGNTAIIGARSDDEADYNAGAAYLFDLTTGIQLFKLRASDAASSALFGQAVAISGNTAIVGAHDGNNYRGSAYLFDVSTGSELSQLNLADAEVGDMFGVSVAISGDIAVVGAYGDDASRGSAHVYDVSNPCNPVKLYSLTIPNSLPQDEFGNIVEISGTTLLVGAYQKSDPILGAYSGAVYLFDLATGDQLAKLVPSDVAPDDRFGLGAALDGRTAIVGSIWDDDRGSKSGSAYVFENICEPTNIAPIANAGTGQTAHIGTLVNLNGIGSYDPDENYPLSYSWQMTSKPPGSEAELFDSDLVNPSFYPDVEGDYTIELVVTDSLGLDSQPDSVVISTYNTPPVADAGDDRAVVVIGSLVQLDGSDSYDIDGDEITYLWTMTQKPDGSLAELSDPCAVDPNFIADVHGDYIITLVVTDIFGAESTPDIVTVSFDNVIPVAEPGGNHAVVEGDTVCFNGSGSYDGNGDELTYNWSIVTTPPDSNAVLSDSNIVNPCIIADLPGSYVISLVVNDGFEDSLPVNVSVIAISNEDAASGELIDAVDMINSLDPNVFKNDNMVNALTNKINAALELIDQGYYLEALDKLQNDILAKTNGCGETGTPDKNDWIETCEEQVQVYPLILQAIQYLEQALQQ